MRRALEWSLLCVLLLSALPALADDFFFRNGDDPIVFLGDSITEQRMYTAYIEAYVLSRFPEWNVRFRNIGWGGDTSWLSKRGSFDNGLKRDILSLKPAAITIDFGMNDARGGDNNLAQYIKYQTLLAQALKGAGARVALVTPSPEERDEAGQPGGSGYNNMLWKYSQALKQVAADQGVKFVDQYTGFVKVIEDGRAAKLPNFILIPDHVHPNWAGHLIMAHQILKGLGAPSLVSRATVDADSGLCPKAEKCIISNVKMDGDVLSFTRLDDCLPMPVRGDSAMVFSVPGYDFLDDLNRYEVAVTGLKPGNYDLAIDGERIATYTAEQLAVGANIALSAGAITRQGLYLLSTVLDKNNVYFNRWRNVQVFDFPYWAKTDQNEELRGKELARLDGDIADREAKINALRKPVPHVFSIRPVP